MSSVRSERLRRRVPASAKELVKDAVLRFRTLSAARRALPDFLIIGTQRGGTTSLYNYLVRHPAIVGTRLTKEVHYFDLNFERGERWYRAFFPTRDAVERLRRKNNGALAIGEASPYYQFHPHVPGRVADLLPDARFIVMLRDPVERAWSHYRHEVELGYERLPFEAALQRERERVAEEAERLRRDPTFVSVAHQHFSYLARGEYASQMEAWFELFPRERFCIVRSEDFFAEPARVFHEVQAFLGVSSWDLDRYPTYNATVGGGMPAETHRGLVEHFRPHNERLERLLGRSFGWED